MRNLIINLVIDLISGFGIIFISQLTTEYIINNYKKISPIHTHTRYKRRLNTLNSFVRSIVILIMVISSIVIILTNFFNVTPILEGVGIFGFIISFSLQNLLNNYINGIFIFTEDIFSIGDYIKLSNPQIEGIVINMTLRSFTIKNNLGEITTIPNSTASLITNTSIGFSVISIKIQFNSDEELNSRIKDIETRISNLPEDVRANILSEKIEIIEYSEDQSNKSATAIIKTKPSHQNEIRLALKM